MLEKKYMDKESWKRVIKRKYIYKNLENYTGVVSLLYLKELTSPCFKEYIDKKIKIADNEYWWLQIGMAEENWWLTVMYDEKMRLIQYYFDISYKNTITQDGKSSFEDLFLDVVILKDGQKYLLDKFELEEALRKEEITQEQYKIAYNTASKILNMSEKNRKQLDAFCYNQLEKLKEKINR